MGITLAHFSLDGKTPCNSDADIKWLKIGEIILLITFSGWIAKSEVALFLSELIYLRCAYYGAQFYGC